MALCGANKNDWQIRAMKEFIIDNMDTFEGWLEDSSYVTHPCESGVKTAAECMQ